MSSGLDWERFGVITGGDEVCILPPPTFVLKRGGYTHVCPFPKKQLGSDRELYKFINHYY